MRKWEEFHLMFSERIAALPEEDRNDLDYALGKIIHIFERMMEDGVIRHNLQTTRNI